MTVYLLFHDPSDRYTDVTPAFISAHATEEGARRAELLELEKYPWRTSGEYFVRHTTLKD